jgi:hypothetical protein
MKPIRLLLLCAGLLATIALAAALTPAEAQAPVTVYLPAVQRQPQAPTLKWSRGGCTSWCETGWYSSPAVANLDGDPQLEVIGATYSVFAIDGATGAQQWRVDPPGDRAWPGVVVTDLDANGDLEIVTAHGGGYLHLWSPSGVIEWSRQVPPGNELRSLAVFDLDANGDLEIVVASTAAADQWWVYDHDGTPRGGEWPQHGPDSATNGYSHGAYNMNIGIADLDGDGRGEIIGPSDVHYITAYEDDGRQTPASLVYGTLPGGLPKPWSRVGVHVSHAVDLRGYANCGSEHRPNFASTAPTLADVNGDGRREVIVVGNVYNCATDPYTSLYDGLFIFNPDRTRWAGNGFDWTAIPAPEPGAAPLSEDYNLIENNQPNPATADLDGDGQLEILYPSYDGRMHTVWLDKTEHGAWPFSVYRPSEGFYRFASEPVVADLSGDGPAEVLFVSWPQKGTGATGRLHVLDYLGNVLFEVSLPAAATPTGWNGALAAPTLANFDTDPALEVAVLTSASGLVAYDLPGTANARILWGTGRGSYWRNGAPP